MEITHIPTVRKPIAWFKDNPENYQEHSAEQVADLVKSLERFGELKNVVALPDGTLLAGHGIIEAARLAGASEFDVKVFEGEAADAVGFLIADNEIAKAARRDDAQLAKLLKGLQDGDEGLSGTGYDDAGLKRLLDGLALPDTFPEYDENIDTSGVKTVQCPECGHEFPV